MEEIAEEKGRHYHLNWVDWVVIVGLIAAALAVRIPLAAERKILPAGDAFNFQQITSHIIHGQYPPKEKRLPGYPLFLLIGRAVGADPIRTSIAVSVIASSLTPAALYLLGRRLTIQRPALAAVLGLVAFDPLLVLSGLRPLADGLFVLLIAATFWLVAVLLTTHKPSRWLLYTTGAVATLMMFTRYEGFLIAGLTLPFLWLKLSWKKVLLVAAIPLLVSIAWIPAYLSIHGTFKDLGYLQLARDPNKRFGDATKIMPNLDFIVGHAGWKRAWAYPGEVQEEEKKEGIALTKLVLSSPSWWLSVLGVIGVVWLAVRGGWPVLPLFAAAIGYSLVLAWWWVYSRYVTPISALFYLTAAAGASALLSGMLGLAKYPRLRPYAAIGYVVLTALFIGMVYQEGSLLHKRAIGISWEDNRKGFAYYRAVKELTEKPGKILFAKDTPMAAINIGFHGEPANSVHEGRGIYLNATPETSPEEIYQLLEREKVDYVVETGDDERMKDIVSLLKEKNNIAETNVVREVRWKDQELEEVPVHHLQWP